MDILIKNMEMPKDTGSITVTIYSDGSTSIWTEQEMIAGGMAVALPEHGRLIDADVFWKRLQKQTLFLWTEKSKEYQYFLDVMDMIKSASTVLEATEWH